MSVKRAVKAVLLVTVATTGFAVAAVPASAASVADPPTIGTATAGVASVSVTFTPPLNDGGSAITSYTATCSSSNGGGAAATSGGSSPIIVLPLSNGKTYTC